MTSAIKITTVPNQSATFAPSSNGRRTQDNSDSGHDVDVCLGEDRLIQRRSARPIVLTVIRQAFLVACTCCALRFALHAYQTRSIAVVAVRTAGLQLEVNVDTHLSRDTIIVYWLPLSVYSVYAVLSL